MGRADSPKAEGLKRMFLIVNKTCIRGALSFSMDGCRFPVYIYVPITSEYFNL